MPEIVRPMPFEEALDKQGLKSIIVSQLNSEQWADVPVGLRERAFFSSQVENARFLQRARDGINDFLNGAREQLPNGEIALKTGSRAEFVKQLQEFAIAEGMGPVNPKDIGTIKDIRSQRRLELIFDTQTRQAQDFGNWKQGMDPDILAEFPAQRFIRVRGVKEPRDRHRPFENQVRLKTDLQFWLSINQDFGVPWGPWAWGCGHDVEDVDRDEAEELGLIAPGQPINPVDKDFNDQLEASTRGLDEDILNRLVEEFGDQITVAGDSVKWNKKLPGTSTPSTSQPALDQMAEEWKTARPDRRRELAETARQSIQVPAAERQPVALNMKTTSKAVQRIARAGADIVSRYTSANLLKRTKVDVKANRGSRAYHSNGAIHLNSRDSASTAAHEIMHGVEIQNQAVLRASAEFLLRRSQGESALPLRLLTGIPYRMSERAFRDMWLERNGSVYSGKLYKTAFGEGSKVEDIRATEILTVGIQRLHDDPLEFYNNDREYFDFVVTTLRML